MNRVVLDTNIIVSALLVPKGTQAIILLLALRGDVALYVSSPILDEYEEVVRRPRFQLQPRQIEATLADIRKNAEFVRPMHTLAISTHESDNRFLECAEAAKADYLVTGNARHFPLAHKTTKVVTGRQFLDIIGAEEPDHRK